jgi:1-acyl-sn-glycerol-3-phosphate acyltransferase
MGKNNQRLLRLYRWTMWNVVSRLFVRFWLMPKYRFSRQKGSDPVPKPPFIIVANHGTFFDPWIIGYFSRYPLAIMCNDDAFRGSAVTRWYLNSIGAFPKKKGASDFRAMKKTMSLLASGMPVCIFPEGQTSWDGETQLLYRGIEKIIRHSRVPLVMVRMSGSFLTKPWWADRLRKGRIECLFRVLAPDYIQSISENDLFFSMKTFLAHNDIKEHGARGPLFLGHRCAEGLERFVWICMNCESEDTLVMKGDTVRCLSCGSSWSMNALCRLSALKTGIRSFSDLHDWTQWHKIKVRSRIRSASPHDILTVSAGVDLMASAAGGGRDFGEKGRGSLALSKENLTFANDDGRLPPLVFPVPEIEDCVIQRNTIFEIRYGEGYYRFSLNGHSPMKWVYYVRYLKAYEKLEKQGYIG